MDNWVKKKENKHGFATNMGTALAVDGFVIEIIKLNAADLNGQEVKHTEVERGLGGLFLRLDVIPMQKCTSFKQIGPGLQMIQLASEVQCCIIYFAAEAYQISCTLFEMRLIHH